MRPDEADGKLSYGMTVLPVTKPLQCWLVCDSYGDAEPVPDGPYEVHAMAVLTSGVEAYGREDTPYLGQGKSGRTTFNASRALDFHASCILDVGYDPETLYFIPGAEGADGSCWWPAKYVRFDQEHAEKQARENQRNHEAKEAKRQAVAT